MAERTITVTVPPETYEFLAQWAEDTQQSLEEATLAALRAVAPTGNGSAAARAVMLAALDDLDTPTLWQMVRRGAETEAVLVLTILNQRRQQQGLTEAEEAVVQDLIRQHDRAVLIRAKALALLRQRGEDVSDLVAGA